MSHCLNSASKQAAAWEALLGLDADVALLQEFVPPVGTQNVVYRQIGGARVWGSAVVGLTVDIEEVTHSKGRYNKGPVALHQTAAGVAVAKATVGGVPITFVSMYGVIDDGYADTTIHRQLSDLVPLLDSVDLSKNLVLGGDLNITTQWIGKEAAYREWEQATFARISAFGLVDVMNLKRPDGPLEGCGCLDGDACRHIHTQRHGRSPRPWMNDYLFASKPLATLKRVRSAVVLDEPALHGLSGHMPLVVDFAFA